MVLIALSPATATGSPVAHVERGPAIVARSHHDPHGDTCSDSVEPDGFLREARGVRIRAGPHVPGTARGRTEPAVRADHRCGPDARGATRTSSIAFAHRREHAMPQGRPDHVPDDGLTTRQRRNRPLTFVHTGPGKGKSTAAFGLALRAWNQGWPVGVFQFVKSAKWRIGEEAALRALGELHTEKGQGAPVVWHKMGEGWSWIQRPGTEADHAADAAEGWAQIKRDLAAERFGLYVLDEFTYPMKWGWVDVDDVVATLADRPGRQHVVITGRDADPRLCAAVDLVTEMTKIKHPMDQGQKGQRGIEW